MKTYRILIVACAAAHLTAGASLYRESRVIMGTSCEIQVYDSNAARAKGAIRAALDEMARVDQLLSNYNPASELSTMNREAPQGPFHASPELFSFVTACRRFYDDSEGTFDPTVGALVRAWGSLRGGLAYRARPRSPPPRPPPDSMKFGLALVARPSPMP